MKMSRKNHKVLLGLSGGVDSAAAALLLKEQGFSVTGYYFDTGCGKEDGRADAERAAKQLEIPFVYEDVSLLFQETVIRNFCQEYSVGRTPNPCIICNPAVKFRKLLDMANRLEISYIATGHYARIFYDKKEELYYIRKGANEKKDQSYMLYRLEQPVLERLLFPLGEIQDKEEVRKIARSEGLSNAEKKDSQEICFIPDNDYVSYIEKQGIQGKTGDFIDRAGNVLGQHRGIFHYTIGQRKGLGIALGKPAFVTRIDPETNQVILGDNEELFSRHVVSSDNFFGAHSMAYYDGASVKAKIRYSARESEAILKANHQQNLLTAQFCQPQRAATAGQSIVFYQEDMVIGGGFIWSWY